MTSPRPEVAHFIDSSFPGARVTAIAGDASTRRFYRVQLPDRSTRVLMDYGQPLDGETDDVRLARVFLVADLPVARILGVKQDAGCLVLEDLGERTLEMALDAEWRQPAQGSSLELLRQAARLAADVAALGTPALSRSERASGPALDSERFRWEMNYYLEHYVRGLCGTAVPSELDRALQNLADLAARGRPVMCHRDYHSRNLMLRDDGSLAMVDIQDARWGPDSYDLASLLYDAYIEIDDGWRDPIIESYLSALGQSPPPPGFRSRLPWVAAQRMIKALGTFGYQIHVRGQPRYGSAIPRTLDRLRRLLPTLPEATQLQGLLAQARLLDTPAVLVRD